MWVYECRQERKKVTSTDIENECHCVSTYTLSFIYIIVVVDLAPLSPPQYCILHTVYVSLYDDLEVRGATIEWNSHPDLGNLVIAMVTESVRACGNLGADIPPQRGSALLSNPQLQRVVKASLPHELGGPIP